MKQINWFEKIIGSALLTGYIPIASGTFGSLVGVLFYFIPGFEKLFVIIPAIIILYFYGVYVSEKFEKVYGKDPAQSTVDEVVGTWIALIALPKTILIVLTSFLIWRALDIIKPFPARDSEKLKGGWGIMTDDVISGFYSLVVVHIIVYFFGVY
ncbi:MAG: phosphatidylglycerophosphatase A [Ignavibacteriales bacterium]|nr:phosphatidylglycerophosphatase A [Ignavibacteriales bacterium]